MRVLAFPAPLAGVPFDATDALVRPHRPGKPSAEDLPNLANRVPRRAGPSRRPPPAPAVVLACAVLAPFVGGCPPAERRPAGDLATEEVTPPPGAGLIVEEAAPPPLPPGPAAIPGRAAGVLPADFPPDFPAPPGASLVDFGEGAEGVPYVTFFAPATRAEVERFLAAELRRRGWEAGASGYRRAGRWVRPTVRATAAGCELRIDYEGG